MNLFSNIFDQFTGQAQPQVHFGTPQAPRTTNYVTPNIPTTTTPKIAQGVRNGGFAPGYEGTVDATKGSFFQGLQGVQNVVRELPKALEATAQSGKKQFDEDIKKKQQSFVSEMLAEGYKEDAIFQALDQLKAQGEFDFKPGISGNIVGGLGERIGDISQTTERLSQIQDPIDRTVAGVLPYAGQTVATALQPITSAIEPYVSPVVQKIIEKTGQTENIQSLSEGWSQFEKTNPILAENIAGLLNVSQLAPVPVGKVLKPAVVGTGKAIVKGANIVAPKATAIIKKPLQIVKNKANDIFGKEIRPVQDIAGNILQPYKGMVESLDDATSGLRRVVEETGTNSDTFQGLLGKIDETLTKYGKMKQESLSQITQTKKSVSAQKALENLENVYDGVSSKDMLATQSRVRQLAKKNMQEGLTPLEMDEIKVLHTKANNLFNEKGQTTGGFSSDDLRGIRKDLKNEIEDFAEANGVTNIREINKAYGEIADAKTLAQNQVDNLTSYKGRQIPSTRIQKIADFIMEFPVIKQAFSDPARILASSLFKTLRGDKINPIEVQKRLPSFLKELKEAGMKSGDLQKIEKMIQNEIKLLPAPSGKPLSANIVNIKPSTGTPKSDAMIGKQGNIPGTSKKETIIKPEFRSPQAPRVVKNIKEETRPNQNILAKNQGVIVGEQKLLPAPKKLKNGNSNNNRTSSTNNSKKIVKPNTIKNESKVNKPISGDTIPEGYIENPMTGEIIKKPSWKTGGFIKIPEIGKKVEKKEIQDLAVLHNLSLEKIKKINELGGLPGPSLAVTKKSIPFEDFGDITLVGDKDLIQSMKAKTYSADIYSPRVPQPDIKYKNPKIVSEISKKTGIDEWKVDSDIKDGYYKGKEEYKQYIDDIENSIEKRIFKGFTYSGNRKYSAYNLDNVIKEMFSKGNQGAESSIFAGNLSQTMGKEAKALTIPQIKKANIGSSPELDSKYTALKDEWSDIVGWDGASAINESFTSKGNPDSILIKLHEYSDGKKFDLSDVKRLQEIVTEATNLPKTYLETKFTRAVGLKEFRGVIAPVEQIPELKQLLKGTGLEDKIVGYKQGESRMGKLEELQKKYGNIFFNVGGAYVGMKVLQNYLTGDDENKPKSIIKK